MELFHADLAGRQPAPQHVTRGVGQRSRQPLAGAHADIDGGGEPGEEQQQHFYPLYYNPSHMTADSTPDLPRLYELESEVMEEVWRQDGPTTVRAIMAALNARADKERAYTTIMTIMARLARKGVLRRELHGKTYLYAPVASREDYMELRARAEVGALVEEYGELALASFAREIAKLDAGRSGELERLARKRA